MCNAPFAVSKRLIDVAPAPSTHPATAGVNAFLIRFVLLPGFLLLSTLSWGAEYLSRLDSITQFEPLQRLERPNGMQSLPDVMFAWDRKENRTYFINSRQYRFHIDFLRAHYLTTESGKAFYQRQYLSDQRRWVLGVVAWQEVSSRYTFELWEGDNADTGLIEAAYQALQSRNRAWA